MPQGGCVSCVVVLHYFLSDFIPHSLGLFPLEETCRMLLFFTVEGKTKDGSANQFWKTSSFFALIFPPFFLADRRALQAHYNERGGLLPTTEGGRKNVAFFTEMILISDF